MLLGLALSGGCLQNVAEDHPDGGGVDDGDAGTGDPPGAQCLPGKTWIGFAGRQLDADRLLGGVESDRDRIKPYDVLGDEYERVLGQRPALIDTLGTTFGQDAARWYTEPGASAITLYSAYRVAFQGCLQATATGPEFAAAPTMADAPGACTNFAVRFWSGEASASELDACVATAVTDTAAEKDARRRWAYTCAAVLSSAGFLTY